MTDARTFREVYRSGHTTTLCDGEWHIALGDGPYGGNCLLTPRCPPSYQDIFDDDPVHHLLPCDCPRYRRD